MFDNDGYIPAECYFPQPEVQSIFEGSLWWWEHLRQQDNRYAQIANQIADDRKKAQQEQELIMNQIINGTFLLEDEKKPEEIITPSKEVLLAKLQEIVIAEKIASGYLDQVFKTGNMTHVKKTVASLMEGAIMRDKSDDTVNLKFSEKIQNNRQDDKTGCGKNNSDGIVLWANILAQAKTIVGTPASTIKKVKSTTKKGQELGVPIIDISIRKAAKHIASETGFSVSDVTSDLVKRVKNGPEIFQNFPAVIRLLRDITSDMWTVCASCKKTNDTPWDKCAFCGIERGEET